MVDTNPAQLRFAHDAFEAIGAADSWSDICSLPGYSPKSEETSRAEHDQLYQAVCAGRADWSFHTLFLQCDMLTQTFRLIEFLKRQHVHKLAFWYSNIFHLYFENRFSEYHRSVELSFVRLMQREFPGISSTIQAALRRGR